MTHTEFFVGVGATVLGVLIGCWVTYRFQKKLLEQQLAFMKEQAIEDAKLRRQIHDEWREVFQEFRDMVNRRADSLTSKLVAELAARKPGTQ